jgi:hypothetical protein
VASKSKLLRVGSVEHRNRNHPLARVILSGLSIEHLGVKFCRGKSRDAISLLGSINEPSPLGDQSEFQCARESG